MRILKFLKVWVSVKIQTLTPDFMTIFNSAVLEILDSSFVELVSKYCFATLLLQWYLLNK